MNQNREGQPLSAIIHLAVSHVLRREADSPMRDLLISDFRVARTVQFTDFSLKCYAPAAFRHLRQLYSNNGSSIGESARSGYKRQVFDQFVTSVCGGVVETDDYPKSIGRTIDGRFLFKSVRRREAKRLLRLLQQYYLILTQGSPTLLPRYCGLFRCRFGFQRVFRFVAIADCLLPMRTRFPAESVELYDLKGSTYKRRADPAELRGPCPLLKDLDFREMRRSGFLLAASAYDQLTNALASDCMALRSYGFTNYSLVLCIVQASECNAATIMDNSNGSYWCLPARNKQTGEHVLLCVGLTDVLQSYPLSRRLAHALWSLITDGSSVSVVQPNFYAERCQEFIRSFVLHRQA